MPAGNKYLRPERLAYLGGLAAMGTALLFLVGSIGIMVAAVAGILCVGVVAGGRSSVLAVRAGRWAQPGTWLSLSAACLSAGIAGFALAGLTGIFSGGLDVREACVYGNGVRYDDAYREKHAAEFQHWFPLHSKCNENFDLVPAWVNPAMVIFALLAAAGVLCLAAAVVTALRRRDG